MLKIDFYESGIGDTVVVTFPDGGVGVVDAHPGSGQRPPLEDLVKGRRIHFLCLTHPHEDHGLELINVAKGHPQIASFWHTVSELSWFFSSLPEIDSFPSNVRDFARRQREEYAACFIELFSAVDTRKIPKHLLRANNEAILIADVEIHCLSPEEEIQNRFSSAHRRRLARESTELPDANLLSAILALRYGDVVILLGADALKTNWVTAIERYFRLRLPKARILKVPHHGAANAFDFGFSKHNYLDVCDRKAPADSVLFAGDSKHPEERVFDALRRNTTLRCVANGRLGGGKSNPLNIEIPGAWSPREVRVCNPRIGYEILPDGNVNLVAGTRCEACCYND